jgi:hypothetical protein
MPNETACVPEYRKHLPFKYHEEFEIEIGNILVSYSEVRWVLLAKPLKTKKYQESVTLRRSYT